MEYFTSMVPLDVRQKLQLFLLLRHPRIPCPLSTLEDEYLTFYKEAIKPQMYGYNSWHTLLKSLDKLVEVKSSRGCKAVYPHPLTNEMTASVLRRIFPVNQPHLLQTVANFNDIEELLNGSGMTEKNRELPDEVIRMNTMLNNETRSTNENIQDNVTSSSGEQEFLNAGPVRSESLPARRDDISAVEAPSEPGIPVIAVADSNVESPPSQDLNDFGEVAISGSPEHENVAYDQEHDVTPTMSEPRHNEGAGELMGFEEQMQLDSEQPENDSGQEDVKPHVPAVERETQDVKPNLAEVRVKTEVSDDQRDIKPQLSTADNGNGLYPNRNEPSSEQQVAANQQDIKPQLPEEDIAGNIANSTADSVNLSENVEQPDVNNLIIPSLPVAQEGGPNVDLPDRTHHEDIKPETSTCRQLDARKWSQAINVGPLQVQQVFDIIDSDEEVEIVEVISVPPRLEVSSQNNTAAGMCESTASHNVMDVRTNHLQSLTREGPTNELDLKPAMTLVAELTTSGPTDADGSSEDTNEGWNESLSAVDGGSPQENTTTDSTDSELPIDLMELEVESRPIQDTNAENIGAAISSDESSSRRADCRKRRGSKRGRPKRNASPLKSPSTSPIVTKKARRTDRIQDSQPSGSKQHRPENSNYHHQKTKYVTDINWFKPDPSKLQGFEHCMQYKTEPYDSSLLYIDRKATNMFLDDGDCGVGFKALERIRNDKDENVLRFHTFWTLTPSCKTPKLEEVRNDDSTMGKLSYEAIQLLNLDVDMNYLLSQSTHGPLTFISSYGNFEDYFLGRIGDGCRGFGLMSSEISVPDERSDIYYNHFLRCKDTFIIDVLNEYTKSYFEDIVRSNITSPGVDIFVANGMGHHQIPRRAQDICLAHFLFALDLVREGGKFVLKLEDTLTSFGVGLLFLMSRCFNQIAIHKPVTALPGERFIICLGKRADDEVQPVREFVNRCYSHIDTLKRGYNQEEITNLFIPNDMAWRYDVKFVEYIRRQNNSISSTEWQEYQRLVKDSKLMSVYQKEIVIDNAEKIKEYWKFWNLFRPLDVIVKTMNNQSSYSDPGGCFQSLFSGVEAQSILDRGEKSVTSVVTRYNAPVGYMSQWSFIPSSGSGNRAIIVAHKDHLVYKYDRRWQLIRGLELTAGTVLYGEILTGSSPTKVLNIIDAARIGCIDIRHMNFKERRSHCVSFALNMDVPFNSSYRVICLNTQRLQELPSFLSDVAGLEKGKGIKISNSDNPILDSVNNASTSAAVKRTMVEFLPTSILIVKMQRAPDVAGVANSLDDGDACDFGFVMKNRLFWEWNPRSNLNSTALHIPTEFLEDFATAVFEFLAAEAKN